jgi:hypothetical protein
MRTRLRRLWNGFRWGSPSGPRIVIDLTVEGDPKLTFENMSARLTLRTMRWLEVRK